MKPNFKRRLPVILLMLTLLLAGISATASAQAPTTDSSSPQPESYDIAVYRVDNVINREDRTAIAQTGASIDEIGKHYVIVSATPQEASAIAALGYPIEQLVSPLDFPPADAAYHNYAEMSDEISGRRHRAPRHRQPIQRRPILRGARDVGGQDQRQRRHRRG